ncbi:hypothetical protein PFISCL1PPCAC_2931 [Pristionchus fissidentatus]|uniref:Uncharacterized protein n=1 Tax=Pristionchus fissidentatus TaxID=1538716 RepID=A0AAV5V109_9BILA|nr:hypothetical protein PFISCL1PPCAC_2931 [Pristionchus fissidentatus]
MRRGMYDPGRSKRLSSLSMTWTEHVQPSDVRCSRSGVRHGNLRRPGGDCLSENRRRSTAVGQRCPHRLC